MGEQQPSFAKKYAGGGEQFSEILSDIIEVARPIIKQYFLTTDSEIDDMITIKAAQLIAETNPKISQQPKKEFIDSLAGDFRTGHKKGARGLTFANGHEVYNTPNTEELQRNIANRCASEVYYVIKEKIQELGIHQRSFP